MAEFAIGQIVAVRADPSRIGPILEELGQVGGRRRFRVFHGPGELRDYLEDQLVAAELEDRDDPAGDLASGKWLDPRAYRAHLVASRLLHPQIDSLYALQAARIRFIPFQFKPILRLLRADSPRLLIADDVGVGKTIEAGLILKELQARQPLGNVLVICPKALTGKWRREMRRFDEDFRILSSESLRYCLDEVHSEGEWPLAYSRAIVHYELFRGERFLKGYEGHRGLFDLDPPPAFGLLIADEAHHVRNPGRLGHQLMEYLCDVSDAVLLLTATPIQTHARDLFTLLRLLRPDQFLDQAAFQAMLEPNRYLTAAMRAVRQGDAAGVDWSADAARSLDMAAATAWGRAVIANDPRFSANRAALARPERLDDVARVRCLRDLEELHSFAHVMNRTRRRDIGRFTIREPRTVSVPFTDAEEQLYEELLHLRRDLLLLEYDPIIVRLVLDTLERQAASSIHALAGAIDRVLSRSGIRLADLIDQASDEDPDEVLVVPPELVERAHRVRALAGRLPPQDPKFEQLLQIVRDAIADAASPGKVLAFSFFLNTIDYLAGRLAEDGARVGVVTGRLADPEREQLRNRFRLERTHPDALDVLLSSEVGCEGLDYEFCDRIVNYDIPWNPMRIEQRIGRIDRFGQKSDKVLIFNFVTPGTVEERIFHRCFERIGVFREAVGDLEDILGGLVEDLTRLALDPTLSAEQAEARARQLADNAVLVVEEQRRLDEQAGDLFGLDEAFVSEVQDVVEQRGRFVHPDDLRLLIQQYLDEPELRGRLRDQPDGLTELQLAPGGRRELAARLRRRDVRARSRADLDLLHRLEQDDSAVVLTFDQDIAVDRREVIFVTPVHPLARVAAEHFGGDTCLVGGLRVISDRVPAGAYVFSFDRWETLGARPDVRLIVHALEARSGRLEPDLGELLLGPVESTQSLDIAGLSSDVLGARLRELEEVSERRRRTELTRLATDNEVLVSRRVTSFEQSAQGQQSRLEEELRDATDVGIQRMKTGQLRRLHAEVERRSAELERARAVDIVTTRVGIGIVEVAHAV